MLLKFFCLFTSAIFTSEESEKSEMRNRFVASVTSLSNTFNVVKIRKAFFCGRKGREKGATRSNKSLVGAIVNWRCCEFTNEILWALTDLNIENVFAEFDGNWAKAECPLKYKEIYSALLIEIILKQKVQKHKKII